MKERKQLVVSALKNGTVIDHIPAENLFKVLYILALDKSRIQNQITFGTNLESKKLGKKAIIKLSDIYFKQKELNKIALVAPQAKINVIKDYAVVEKKIVEVPEEIHGIVKCVNPQCITNNQNIPTWFKVVTGKAVALKCHYCEKITDQSNMEII